MHFLIYDDVPADAQALSEQLRRQVHDCRVSVVYSGTDAFRLAEERTLNALFLDIELTGNVSGIEFAAQFRKSFPYVPVVFYTGHSHYCEEIFTVSPAALLLKPPTAERIRRVMRILQSNTGSDAHLTLSTGKTSLQQIPLNQIAYIETIRRRLTVFSKDGRILAEVYGKKLAEIEHQLVNGFVLCHQSIIVNMEEITSIRRYSLTLRSGQELPISQRRFSAMRKCWGEYLGETL